MQKVFFKTFGCRTNIYDTELMKRYIKDYEITNDEDSADIVIINSCTVTNSADSGVRAYINSVRRRGAKVVLTGCGAVSKGKELFDKNGIFGVIGASEKANINTLLNSQGRFFELGNLKSIDRDIVTNYENHTKAFIKIQEGCNFSCSYCIIPSVRGKARSMDEQNILNEAKILSQNGYNELVLTGTNIGSYGKDTGSSLGALLANLGKISGIKRIRLGSIEPSQIDDSFREILNEPWLEKHLHIALQHTSERMLRIMRRRNEALRDLELFYELSELGFALGTDYIVGHPGESEEIWDEGLENFKKFPLTHLHAFVYSPRFNTHSATMKVDVSGDIAKVRLNTLKEITRQKNLEFRKQHKVELGVLVEQKNNEFYEGFDQFYNKIKIKSERDISKEWLWLKDYEIEEELNYAKI
ncbi:tRNA (N(6)-L-threonylcarbamoyladenosine(37)-C(2))-methylthiotransferase MtaB [Campylobacter sp. RM9344]|uniref:tRNA (N(6)-L-threonylcarbamoyladenosine(37)-C(2))-methylthiotransferase MtaB n=2 Tax=Campylobacter californiensis TaxID=1032243 RepID=A0AAW3ZW66_9BACT|nr:tRNA (N(6)-L-threonylcarbamoyladenosine(37)-C(2))-methylthiotransferase MtaB [Campylobacter sp. RM6883]MBE2994801.1 tRNA (N(6)-L-threonylcarbamoyladenosine(37)-C(2))-methylthiotransferase MtaB [Campylobacter sp. RM6913]MBE3029423.1 tRNA (N(6)-L-threonylcarbamoyladenosine(37)-C(2))-methylthiotransferase MtaB [Campylobacter sp. RM9344]MBE3608693.1 tRNA (N(6)-L-threonylcarbamoyladenosine(37)-C(2))-methylthiotransferase MtaB [Campylobacter sp. RM9337]